MTKTIVLLLALILAASSTVTVLPIKAEKRTITVPTNYPTIQDAINAACDGDTVFVKKGTYHNAVNQTLTINKTISLVGEDPDHTIIVLYPQPYVSSILYQPIYGHKHPILVDGDNVTLSGFTVISDNGEIAVSGKNNKIINNNLNARLRLTGAGHAIITNNTITASLFIDGSYSHIYENNIINTTVSSQGSFNSLYSNNVVNGRIGSVNTGTTVIYNNTVRNGLGIRIGGNTVAVNNTVVDGGFGVSIDLGYNSVVYGNRLVNNTVGILKLDGDNNSFFANYVAGNVYGIFSQRWGDNSEEGGTVFFHNNFVGNGVQVKNDSVSMTVYGYESEFFREPSLDLYGGFFDDGLRGNFWSDYVGRDVNGDGVGDTPYVIDEKRQDNYPLMVPFNVDSVSIRLPEWATIELQEPDSVAEPFPTSLIAAVGLFGITIAIISIGLFVHKKKHRSTQHSAD